MPPTLNQLLKAMVEQGGSDLHITTNSPPQVRVDGVPQAAQPAADDARRRPSSSPTRSSPTTRSTGWRRTWRSTSPSASRGWRASAPTSSTSAAPSPRAFRQIPYEIRGFRELGLPPIIEKICEKPRGLVLVTGPTGSGKSTTLAAMLDKINRERAEHIVTIEDPVEYLHSHKKLHRQPARAARRHPQLRQRPALGAAAGPRRGADRRDARPRDHRVGAAHRRDRPPDLRHPAHQLGGADDQPHHRRLPRPPAGADPRPALVRAGGDPLPVAAAQGRAARGARWRWRSWCPTRRSAT